MADLSPKDVFTHNPCIDATALTRA